MAFSILTTILTLIGLGVATVGTIVFCFLAFLGWSAYKAFR